MRILVVDDNRSSADALARALSKRGDAAEAVYDGESALARLDAAEPPEMILTDLRMEPVDGIEVLRAARAHTPPVEVIVFTAYGEVGTAVEAMRLGARDFLTKPISLEQLVTRLDALSPIPSKNDAAATPEAVFVAESSAARALCDTLERYAVTGADVWIQGEIGSGRDAAARYLHAHADGRAEPFTEIDLVRDGPFPATGTLLLAGVDTLPLDVQRKLAHRLRRLSPGVRVITTASEQAEQRLREGNLDKDLFYRLAKLRVDVPPLRDRVADVLPLFRTALTSLAARYRRPLPPISAELEADLLAYDWPGNLRELFNLAERSVLLASIPTALQPRTATGTLGLPDLSAPFRLSDYLEGVERRILEEALARCQGDRTAVGRLLGLERNTLRYKLQKYELLDRP